MAITICITNQKGGTAKTTTVTSLSSGFSLEGYPSLLVDIDPQCNATSAFVEKRDLKFNFYSLFDKKIEDVKKVIVRTGIQFLDLIPSHISMANLERMASLEVILKLKDYLDVLKDKYEWIFIDVPPSLGNLTMMGMMAADFLLIPLRADYYSLEGTEDLMETYRSIKKINKELKILGILMSQFDKRNRICKDALESARGSFGDLIFNTVIGVSVRLQESPAYKQPIFIHGRGSSGDLNYKALMEEIKERVGKQ